MTVRFRTLVGVAALSAAICTSSVSFAQASPPGAAMSTASAEHDQRMDRMRAHVASKARALHVILNIRPEQEGAFQALLATMQPSEERNEMRMHDDQDSVVGITTPQRLDRMAARMSARQAEFQRHADAVKRFYAVLSPDQQRSFDALQGMMKDGGHHGMGREAMGGHHDHGGESN